MDIHTPEGRRAEYDRIAALLAECAVAYGEHRDDVCQAAPVCCGHGMDLLSRQYARHGRNAELLVMVAVGEIHRLTAQVADLSATCMRLDADLLDAHGEADTLRERLAAARTELDLWEESADALGPVGLPD